MQYRTITSADRQKESEGGREDAGVKPLVYPGGEEEKRGCRLCRDHVSQQKVPVVHSRIGGLFTFCDFLVCICIDVMMETVKSFD